MKKKTILNQWTRLDNSAKIFPIIANEQFSNVFRVSLTLKRPIDTFYLQQALEDTLMNCLPFKVKIKKGIFWDYFEINNEVPAVEKEQEYPCSYIDPAQNKGYLFKVTYFQNRINLDVFHAITDGTGALNFLKELTYRYLNLVNALNVKWKSPIGQQNGKEMEDSYLVNYKKKFSEGYTKKKAFQVKGNYSANQATNIIEGTVQLDELRVIAKQKNATLTEYLTAVLIWSIYKVHLEGKQKETLIQIGIPVNLRNFFESSTNRNFFSLIDIGVTLTDDDNSFQSILERVILQFKKNLTKEKLKKRISYNVSKEKNKFLRVIPNRIKRTGLKIAYKNNSLSYTGTISNVGKVEILPYFEKYIDKCTFLLYPEEESSVRCGVCSFKNKLVFTFISFIKEREIEKTFFRKLVDLGASVQIESNGVYHESL